MPPPSANDRARLPQRAPRVWSAFCAAALCSTTIANIACSRNTPPPATALEPAAATNPHGFHAQPSAAPAGHHDALAQPSLARAQQLLRQSAYAAAEAQLRKLLERKPADSAVEFALAELLLVTGRHQELQTRLHSLQTLSDEARAQRGYWLAEAARRQGQREEAEAWLREVSPLPAARRARLALGELLIASGRRHEATEPLLTLIQDHNSGVIADHDADGLALVARAAHLLRSPEDANDAFNRAEQAGNAAAETLLWRAELFLERHNPSAAEEVIEEVLEQAPHHPDALVARALVFLASSLDFDTANQLVEQALAVNPQLSRAYFVLAGLALRDLDISAANRHVERGLASNPRELELLSMQGAIRFVADDSRGFAAVKQRVLQLNPQYSAFFSIVGEYAEWEHRYEEIVALMREAVAIDEEDALAHAQLGLNLIRSGNDAPGLLALRRSFAKDPFNVRVFNTLNLYDDVIARHYRTREHGKFRIRYPEAEAELLDRYVPQLLERAFQKLSRDYAFEPQTPIGIELYSEREHFAIRTSGLPRTAIQGVCFGHTLASMTPRSEDFNLGMVLWHELSHVFHIQKSRSRVPRWFTEGLAEYETIVERPEWRREHDLPLYLAWKGERLPKIGAMNRAFTHVDDVADVATAYYAASQVAVLLAEQHGRDKLNRMLELWGSSEPTAEVVEKALGITSQQLDQQIDAFFASRLQRYNRQFIPPESSSSMERALRRAGGKLQPAERELERALIELRRKDSDAAAKALQRASELGADRARLSWAKLLQAELKGDVRGALGMLGTLIAEGRDGYAVQLKRAHLARRLGDHATVVEAFERAHRFDEFASEPLYELYRLARQAKDPARQLWALEKLAPLEQHDGFVYRELIRQLMSTGRVDRALEVAESAIYVDIDDIRTHTSYAEVLLEAKDFERARFELESALLAQGRPKDRALAHQLLARMFSETGQPLEARKHLVEASDLEAVATP